MTDPTMRYAYQDDVLRQLRIDDAAVTNAETIAMLVRLEHEVAAAFDQKIGRSYGIAPVAQERIVTTGRNPSSWLGLHVAIRSVITISFGGEWNGSVWAGQEALSMNQFYEDLQDANDAAYWGIRLAAGTWPAETPIRILGVWNDQSILEVPTDLRSAATWVVIDEWRTMQAAPTGLLGPDGLTVQVRDVWNLPRIKTVIDRHRHVGLVV